MKYTKYALFAILIIAILTMTACEQEQINIDTKEPILNESVDEYTCDPNAGYTWCPSLTECVQVWEIQCPEYEEYYKEPVACTREYMPVTGELIIPTQDGEITIIKEFSNRCVAEAAGATNIKLVYESDEEVLNFEECVAAGNLVMESHPRQCIHDGELFVEQLNYEELPENKYDACEYLGGTPLQEFNECEYISEDACMHLEGEFYDCESACRNHPDYPDVMCTMQCVQVCKFN